MNTRVYILQNTDNSYFNKISEQERENFLLSCDEIDGVDFISNQETEINQVKNMAKNNLKVKGG